MRPRGNLLRKGHILLARIDVYTPLMTTTLKYIPGGGMGAGGGCSSMQ